MANGKENICFVLIAASQEDRSPSAIQRFRRTNSTKIVRENLKFEK